MPLKETWLSEDFESVKNKLFCVKSVKFQFVCHWILDYLFLTNIEYFPVVFTAYVGGKTSYSELSSRCFSIFLHFNYRDFVSLFKEIKCVLKTIWGHVLFCSIFVKFLSFFFAFGVSKNWEFTLLNIC